ncbi:MAG TPA: dihydropteroate synthase [Stellaceae bacterium]|nr:dihydropteroate synthase [Stellaceae bacterium]
MWSALSPLADTALWPRPLGFLYGRTAAEATAAGSARPLAGGGTAFSSIEALGLTPDRRLVSVAARLDQFEDWLAGPGSRFAPKSRERLARLSAPRPPWAGFALDRPLVMGIVNVTPDSFSDGGRWLDPARAIAHGRAMLEVGADILDIGGESTRPGAVPVSPAEEIFRTEPVVRALAGSGAVVSIDTRRTAVMERAFAAGARIWNDVSALAGDPLSPVLAARHDAAVVLMHMRGEPHTMQQDPVYAAPLVEVLAFLEARIAACGEAGIPPARIAVDPGIGFGKRATHNLELIAGIGAFHALGCAVLIGVSRKSMIAHLSRGEEPDRRLPGSLAALLFAQGQGVQILRVHDVAETRQALALWTALAASS